MLRNICLKPGRIVPAMMISLLLTCHANKKSPDAMKTFDTLPGTYGYDLAFLSKYRETVILSDSQGSSQLIIIPDWQARVMTSTAGGPGGFSYGWINYGLIESGVKSQHMNAYGGEERLWLGPEGGPFSIYFAPGTKQEFNNWYVPAELDTAAFEIITRSRTQASFARQFTRTNYSGTTMKVGIQRTIELLDRESMASHLGLPIPDSVNGVGYQTENTLINLGDKTWDKKSGMLSIWMLSMLTPSPGVTVFIPFRDEGFNHHSPVVHDDYFGKVPADRLIVDKGFIFFKADGKYRSKIGVPPRRAMNYSGSYDAQNKILTILWCELPEGEAEYVNSKWGDQEDPFSGDAINAYNDGPVEDGTQMGPFYELESSSPAAHLQPGEKMVHRQRVYHFEGDEEQLNRIAEKIFAIPLKKVKIMFP
jgi:hypothetical protein